LPQPIFPYHKLPGQMLLVPCYFYSVTCSLQSSIIHRKKDREDCTRMQRDEALARIRTTKKISVLIVGGGVNGIGVFRDLAAQGVDVLLVDKGDFCSGASAASSHMVHGGLRYLENGEFRLVREALKERNLLLQNAP